jgi:flagellar hook-basal body complex protein FliE
LAAWQASSSACRQWHELCFSLLSVNKRSKSASMSDINVNNVLNQMRAMSLQAANRLPIQETSGSTDFSSLLQQSIASVNETQQKAGRMVEAFEAGVPNLSLAEVMVETQKANVSFQAMLQVRNKLVEAYKDVMNMPM